MWFKVKTTKALTVLQKMFLQSTPAPPSLTSCRSCFLPRFSKLSLHATYTLPSFCLVFGGSGRCLFLNIETALKDSKREFPDHPHCCGAPGPFPQLLLPHRPPAAAQEPNHVKPLSCLAFPLGQIFFRK